jgi:hypothetical protein
MVPGSGAAPAELKRTGIELSILWAGSALTAGAGCGFIQRNRAVIVPPLSGIGAADEPVFRLPFGSEVLNPTASTS